MMITVQPSPAVLECLGTGEMQGVDVDEAARNVLSAVVDCGGEGLTYEPQVFRINSLPIDASDREQSERDREAILRYIQSA